MVGGTDSKVMDFYCHRITLAFETTLKVMRWRNVLVHITYSQFIFGSDNHFLHVSVCSLIFVRKGDKRGRLSTINMVITVT